MRGLILIFAYVFVYHTVSSLFLKFSFCRFYLFLELFVYFTYILSAYHVGSLYMYMQKEFRDFSDFTYAGYNNANRFVTVIALVFVMPFLLKKLKLQEVKKSFYCKVTPGNLTFLYFS